MKKPLFSGRSFRVDYDGLSATNSYSDGGDSVSYTITSGPFAGASGSSPCEWKELSEGTYAISWQEANGATVVHVDDFIRGTSHSFFTSPDLQLFRLQGPLTPISA